MWAMIRSRLAGCPWRHKTATVPASTAGTWPRVAISRGGSPADAHNLRPAAMQAGGPRRLVARFRGKRDKHLPGDEVFYELPIIV